MSDLQQGTQAAADELRLKQLAAGAPTVADIQAARTGLAHIAEDQPVPEDARLALERLVNWGWRQARPQHVVGTGGMVHSSRCPACQAAYDEGASWTALPWSETYWSS